MLKQIALRSVPFSFSLLATTVPAFSLTLSTGSGDVSLIVEVDATGSVSSAIFDPLQIPGRSGDPANTVVDSFTAIGTLSSPFQRFDAVATNVQVVEQNVDSVTSGFSIDNGLGSFDVRLTQSVETQLLDETDTFFDFYTGGSALLTQTFEITNTGLEAAAFSLIGYLDADVPFDGTNQDIGETFNPIFVEVAETDPDAPFNVFGAISDPPAIFEDRFFPGTNGVALTIQGGDRPLENFFEIGEASRLSDKILNEGVPLADVVEQDFEGGDLAELGFDGDGLADAPYDAAIALRDAFAIEPGETATFTSFIGWSSFLGNEIPGATEGTPILPTATTDEGGFVFAIPAEALIEGEIAFYDPIIATGYTYTVTGAEFDAVQAPTLAAVNDPDGYTLTVAGMDFSLAPGQLLNFADILGVSDSAVTEFTITGISEALMLDPNDPTAFVTGIAFEDISDPSVGLVQTPIETEVMAPIPLPAAGLLMIASLGGLALLRRGVPRAV